MKNARSQFGKQLQLVIAKDFKYHYDWWNGDESALDACWKEAEPILEMMKNVELDTLLLWGTITWENAVNQSILDFMRIFYL